MNNAKMSPVLQPDGWSAEEIELPKPTATNDIRYWMATRIGPALICPNAPLVKVAERGKPSRLVDVGELEADLKKDLAEEEAKGKAADIPFCENIEDELSDLENLPTVDPESLRPETSMKYDALTRTVTCRNCSGEVKLGEYDNPEDFRYCPFCGFKVEGLTYDVY